MDETFKIDVSRYIDALERTLSHDPDSARRIEALTILQRWQFDEMLDQVCREKARLLVQEYSRGS